MFALPGKLVFGYWLDCCLFDPVSPMTEMEVETNKRFNRGHRFEFIQQRAKRLIFCFSVLILFRCRIFWFFLSQRRKYLWWCSKCTLWGIQRVKYIYDLIQFRLFEECVIKFVMILFSVLFNFFLLTSWRVGAVKIKWMSN